MIPLHKLAKLPRHQRLRKIAKTMTEAERALMQGTVDRAYLAAAAALVAADDGFSGAALKELSAAAAVLAAAVENPVVGNEGLHRPINTIRHILSAEIGQVPADWDFIDAAGHLDAGNRRVFHGMQVYLEDIRSPFNVGSLFRTAESFGVDRLYLSPLCADPGHPRAERTSMGCTAALPWERAELGTLAGPVFALETGGTPLDRFPFPTSGIMIVGSEELGVSPAALEAAERSLGRVSIPTYGAKGSLNVGVAFGIAVQAWADGLSGRADSPA